MLDEQGKKTIIALNNLFVDAGLGLLTKLVDDKLLNNMKQQFPTIALSDETLVSPKISLLYQMTFSTEKNSRQAHEFMEQVVAAKIYPLTSKLLKSYPYNKKENRDFLA